MIWYPMISIVCCCILAASTVTSMHKGGMRSGESNLEGGNVFVVVCSNVAVIVVLLYWLLWLVDCAVGDSIMHSLAKRTSWAMHGGSAWVMELVSGKVIAGCVSIG